MDNRPIGVFDSGLGGLTAVHSLWRILPEEDLIYFGDTARVPYGGRSKETILKYARQDVRFLRSFDLKAILIACGTVSTTSLPTLQRENDLPMVGVVEPTCRRAGDMTGTAAQKNWFFLCSLYMSEGAEPTAPLHLCAGGHPVPHKIRGNAPAQSSCASWRAIFTPVGVAARPP